ncbi:hypothetical protein QQF64_000411 [Cirrhinus molitorella]|uniref:Uncharacterized protein n=1 Tax=Cirrhinus molitorella TaxID=172907 RepID=A0ABR3NX45_9TELE
MQDPRNNTPNGRTCYYCDGKDCSKTISCSGTEDRCATTTSENPHYLGLLDH